MPDWLSQRARISPDRLALSAGEGAERWTFRALDQHVTVAASDLAAMGVGADDRVALLMRNSRTFVVLVHALSRLGAVLVPLNTRLSPTEISWQLRDVRARWLLHDPVNAQAAATAGRDAGRPELRLVLQDEHFPDPLPTPGSPPNTN